MAGMVVQHNMNAINANNKLNANVLGTKKATEKLSSGFQINRAADNAAGLAISEKMRSQTRGLRQATNNANDGISLIQTAEGGLNETHAILQRMRELAVQSANGTYQNETDREAMQLEVDRLKSEVDRIAKATEYNGIKLLDGSLSGGGNVTDYGARYGSRENLISDLGTVVTVSSNVVGCTVEFNIGASGSNSGENAVWDTTGKAVKVNLVQGKHYTDNEINDLIKNATNSKSLATAPAEITVRSDGQAGFTMVNNVTTSVTAAGHRSEVVNWDVSLLVGLGATNGAINSADQITLTANSYGEEDKNSFLIGKISIKTDVNAGQERIDVDKAFDLTAGDKNEITIHLATGTAYSNLDIAGILKKAGFDYDVKLSDANDPDGSSDTRIYFNVKDTTGTQAAPATFVSGAGVGKEYVEGGEGLTFQIGANGVADQRVTLSVKNMSSSAIGIASASVALQSEANIAIDKIDKAINLVSLQRADLGALQNRLEYTVNNLTATNENLTAAESQIRDTDMASEMVNYTKFNILQQAAQAMLAQANQAPQAILQLLG